MKNKELKNVKRTIGMRTVEIRRLRRLKLDGYFTVLIKPSVKRAELRFQTGFIQMFPRYLETGPLAGTIAGYIYRVYDIVSYICVQFETDYPVTFRGNVDVEMDYDNIVEIRLRGPFSVFWSYSSYHIETIVDHRTSDLYTWSQYFIGAYQDYLKLYTECEFSQFASARHHFNHEDENERFPSDWLFSPVKRRNDYSEIWNPHQFPSNLAVHHSFEEKIKKIEFDDKIARTAAKEFRRNFRNQDRIGPIDRNTFVNYKD